MGVYIPPDGKQEMSYTNKQVVVNPVLQQGNGPVNTNAKQNATTSVFNNPSNSPTSGVQKVGDNIHTLSGVKLDNKTVGTNAGANSVNNWITDGSAAEAAKNYVNQNAFNQQVTEAQQRAGTNYAQNITDYMAQNRIGNAENRAAVGNMNAQRTDKINSNPDYSQYANDDIANRAAFYLQYGVDPTLDIEVELDKFANANPVLTAETAPIAQQLLDAKFAKISANPELEQYRNSDAVIKTMAALKQYNSDKQLRDAYNQQLQAYNDTNVLTDAYVQLMKDEAQRLRDANIKKAEADAMEQRRNLIAMSPIADLALQEQLSQMGLTRGANNSSGYGENARLINQLNTNNQIAENYNQLSESQIEYNNAYLDAVMEAERTGLSQKFDVQKLIATVGPEMAKAIIDNEYRNSEAYRNEMLAKSTIEKNKADTELANTELAQQNEQFYAGLNQKADQFDKTYDFDKEKFDKNYALDKASTEADIEHINRADTLAENQFEYQKEVDAKNIGIKTVELFGKVLDSETADMLGVPVGTETMDAINSAKEIAIALMNAETNRDEATSNKLFSLWEATGKASKEVADYFNVPEGTMFYQYVHDLNLANQKKTSNGSGSGSGSGSGDLKWTGDTTPDTSGNYYTTADGKKVNMITAGAGPVTEAGYESAVRKKIAEQKPDSWKNAWTLGYGN